jgi:hypothetical protein
MPANLKLQDTSQRPQGTREFLEHEKWRRWIEDAPGMQPEEEEKVDQFISSCNQALKLVGKPFAYRTARAIRAYVRQYPRIDERWLNHALSDQVEQRVLPKLRGVDSQDDDGQNAIDQVRKLVNSLEDAALEREIRSGADAQHGHQFVWRGIDRAQEE